MQLPSTLRLAIVLALFCFNLVLLAQTNSATSTVSGRVTLGNKPAQGVAVLALLNADSGPPRTSAQAKTDAEGYYRLTGLPAGNFKIYAAAREYVSTNDDGRSYLPGRTVTLSAGELLEGQDLALERGGVITGRVTNAGERPLIEQPIKLFRVNEGGVKTPFNQPYTRLLQTDDRGMYRVYGLPAGRYLVAAGYGEDDAVVRYNTGQSRAYKLTYHPATTEQNQAKVLDVSPGSETSEVDIKLGASSRGHTVAVRVVEAETGRPLPDLRVGYGIVQERSSFIRPSSGIIGATDSSGNARFEGVLPGRYAAFLYGAGNGKDKDYYAEPQPFEVNADAATRLEIVARRGVSVSGKVTFEGVTDAALLARAQKLMLGLQQPWNTANTTLRSPYGNYSPLTPDFSFQINGVAPDKYELALSRNLEARGFTLVRVEHNGAVLGNKLELNTSLSGLRVVVTAGNARILGQIQLTGGVLPANSRLRIAAYPDGSSMPVLQRSAVVDAQGRFVLEDFAAGTYELRAYAMAPTNQLVPNSSPPSYIHQQIASTKQQITVGNTGDTTITLTLDLAAQGRRQ